MAAKAEEPSSNHVRSSKSRKRIFGFIPDECETLEYLVEKMLNEKLKKLSIELNDEELRKIEDRAYRYGLDHLYDYEALEPEGILMAAAQGVREAIEEYLYSLRKRSLSSRP